MSSCGPCAARAYSVPRFTQSGFPKEPETTSHAPAAGGGDPPPGDHEATAGLKLNADAVGLRPRPCLGCFSMSSQLSAMAADASRAPAAAVCSAARHPHAERPHAASLVKATNVDLAKPPLAFSPASHPHGRICVNFPPCFFCERPANERTCGKMVERSLRELEATMDRENIGM